MATLLLSYKLDLNTAGNGVIYFPAPAGTLRQFRLYLGFGSVAVDGDYAFNIAKNGTDLLTGADRIIIAEGDRGGVSDTISEVCVEGDQLELQAESLPGIATGPLLLVVDYTPPSITAIHAVDDTYDGTTINGLDNSGGVTQWDAVFLNGSSEWVKADANGSGTYPARGLAVTAETTGNPVDVLKFGTVRNDGWTWTPGGDIYLSATAGGLTQTAPSTSGDKVQVVGFALTADIAFFDFNSTYLTIA